MIILIATTACEDNNDSGGNGSCPTVPFSTIRLTEDSPYEAGVPTVTTTQTYSYKRGQLAGFTTVQSYSVQNETVKIENTTSVTYEEHQAIATDNFGNVSTYFLNDKGYAIQCTRQEVSATRTYDFSYFTSPEGKPYLKNITESINGKVYASIDIDYSNPQALRIVQKVDTYTQTYTATTPAGNSIINQSEVPCLFFADLYPLYPTFRSVIWEIVRRAFQYLNRTDYS